MDKETVGAIHWSFWLIGVIALLWNVGGAINYLSCRRTWNLSLHYPKHTVQ